jgi:hypothetical protein
MSYPVTLNGRTYTIADFEGLNYVDGFPDALEDFVTHAANTYQATSTTSTTIATGTKTFTVAASKPYAAGTPLRISDAANPSDNFIDAIVTSYSGTTLTVDSVRTKGSGTISSWNINIGGVNAFTLPALVTIAEGGTGATTAAGALVNIGLTASASEINTALDGATVSATELNALDGIPGTLTSTEIGYLDGVTSAIQTQIDAKASVDDPTFTTKITSPQVNVSGQGDLRLEDSAGGQYVALQSPSVLSANYTLTLPADDGDADQVLKTDGSGVLDWTTPAGAYEVVSNTNLTNTTTADFTVVHDYQYIFEVSEMQVNGSGGGALGLQYFVGASTTTTYYGIHRFPYNSTSFQNFAGNSSSPPGTYYNIAQYNLNNMTFHGVMRYSQRSSEKPTAFADWAGFGTHSTNHREFMIHSPNTSSEVTKIRFQTSGGMYGRIRQLRRV